MVAAAERAAARGIRSMVGFSYRRVPAIGLARKLVAARAGSARSASCARCTCRTGSPTRTAP